LDKASKGAHVAYKTAFVAELVPSGRRLTELSIELANTHGALAEVASILSKHKINVLLGFHDAKRWGFFADITEAESSLDGIVKEISSLDSVGKVSFSNTVTEGIIVDTLHERLEWGRFSLVAMRAEAVSSLLKSIRGIFGPGGEAGRVLLHHMGDAAGRSHYKGLADRMGADQARKHIEDIIGILGADGWGDFRLTSLDSSGMTANVTAVNSFEASDGNGASSSSSCDFVAGFLGGVFSEVYGRRMNVVEVQCAGRGGRHCQFEIGDAGKAR
jgi:predicted hydrocarbon binding protein